MLTGITFTPDGRRVVAAGYDSEIRMWDVATGQLAIVLPPPTGPRPGDIAFTARPVFSQRNQRMAMIEWRGFVAAWDGHVGIIFRRRPIRNPAIAYRRAFSNSFL